MWNSGCRPPRRRKWIIVQPSGGIPLQRGNAGRDALRRKRTRSVQNGMRRGASHDSEMREQSAVIQALCRTSDDSRDYRSLRSSVGMQVATLCVARGRGAS
ncbi:hypothetical protein ALQ31_100714, partial [Pseudomonas amygdali pv. morsprunorum]